ncbi:MAG: HAMP domain-containing sensor histidine kinase [Desulfobacterales bacterium]|jgi:signal transduction histidine kinase
MKRLKRLILIFCAALSIPLGYFVWQTYRGLAQEEVATLRFFANTLLDEIEQTLQTLVQREEARVIDEYNFLISVPGGDREQSDARRSPLSRLPAENYILGYFQNNPDGSFQTPLAPAGQPADADYADTVAQLEGANLKFNRIRTAVTDTIAPAPQREALSAEQKKEDVFAERYLDLTRSKEPKAVLGQKEKRFEKITVAQAKNVARQEADESARSMESSALSASKQRYRRQPAERASVAEGGFAGKSDDKMQPESAAAEPDAVGRAMAAPREAESFQVEVAPLQSVFIGNDQIFIFRRIMINQKIYRQGFILRVHAFLNHLAQNYFNNQPMADFTNLRLQVMDQGRHIQLAEAGVSIQDPTFVLQRVFPAPFAFLSATLSCDEVPRSAGRQTLLMMMGVLAAIFLIGIFAIYKSAQTLVDLSERRSQFVSSVTHELKTPLTNIRMYIEMLAQGIARDTEREQEYFQIIDSEGSRLTRLINNVLDLAKLEKKQRSLDLKSGTFEEVVAEVQTVMQAKLKQEGYTLKFVQDDRRLFRYDREAMIQVLINLIENSIKFGQAAVRKEVIIRTFPDGRWMKIAVSDFGPGIPRRALKKIFDDFYRADNSLTQTARGTGIGLALVKKFILLMGGRVSAENNSGAGCTIVISLPLTSNKTVD